MAILHHVRAGGYVRDADDGSLGVVVAGLARAFVWASDGRQVPLRHLRAADPFGLSAIHGRNDAVAVQAVRDSRILEIEPSMVRALAQSDARVANAIACQLSAELAHVSEALQLGLRNAVRNRLAGFLLAISGDSLRPDGLPEPIRLSHEDLAEAVGTAREVVTRHLHVLRRLGIVDLGRGSVTVSCPSRLRDAALRSQVPRLAT